MTRILHLTLLCVLALLLSSPLRASEHHGTVKFGGVPVPGATITAIQGSQQVTTTTNSDGQYSLADLPDGQWTIRIEMPGFAPATGKVEVSASAAASDWDLKMLPIDEVLKQAVGVPNLQTPPKTEVAPTQPNKALATKTESGAQPNGSVPARSATPRPSNVDTPPSAPTASAAAQAIPSSDSASQDELAQKASDGLLINGSALNGASSPFAQNAAFGNNRRGPSSLYNGSLGLIFDNSALDARSFSLSGQDTPKPSYSQLQSVFTLGGPLRIPHLLSNGGTFFVGYQWTRNRNASIASALVPTAEQRNGNLGPGNIVPPDGISPQARALLGFYPLPNVDGNARYNYQTALTSGNHQDALQSRLNKTINQRNQVWGSFAFQRTATDKTNVFGFLDTINTRGFNAEANWQRRVGQRTFVHLQLQYSRLTTHTHPFFADRVNVSANAGILGNSEDPADWGPPALSFASGVAPLSDAQSSFDRNQTKGFAYDSIMNRGRHNVSYGITFRRQQFNYLGQQDARGTFTFTGAGGTDFASFLRGVPDTSSIAFGNADKYFRESLWDAFITDDWRIGPALTLNAGVRWEYAAPITELDNRLVNLDIAPGFAAIAPVVATSPVGSLTNAPYPNSLIHPDKGGVEPRVGLAWRPFPASSTVIRAGYGVYYNTSVYQSVAIQMAQQAPLSKNLSIQNTAANPLTLAQGFTVPATGVPNTFAVDPHFQVGYTQNWQVSIQRDLPGSTVLLATYAGVKGTRGMQEFLPNTYPAGAVNPCLACPSGFIYLASNGNSTRESGQIQLRRRLHNGFTATVQYTLSKSMDDSALGGRGQASSVIAQNWLDLNAEHGPSSFDQRHLLKMQAQYTSGMGIGGGTLLSGWKSTLLKDWTATSDLSAGSGFPLTPQYIAPVPGTGVTGPIRPSLTGAPVYEAPVGFFLNAGAYTAPASGQWGSAGRNSITGPFQFSLNVSLGRTFRLKDRYSLDLRVDSTNVLNHVSYTAWNTTINSTQFGLATGAAPMRSLQTTLRVRF